MLLVKQNKISTEQLINVTTMYTIYEFIDKIVLHCNLYFGTLLSDKLMIVGKIGRGNNIELWNTPQISVSALNTLSQGFTFDFNLNSTLVIQQMIIHRKRFFKTCDKKNTCFFFSFSFFLEIKIIKPR